MAASRCASCAGRSPTTWRTCRWSCTVPARCERPPRVPTAARSSTACRPGRACTRWRRLTARGSNRRSSRCRRRAASARCSPRKRAVPARRNHRRLLPHPQLPRRRRPSGAACRSAEIRALRWSSPTTCCRSSTCSRSSTRPAPPSRRRPR